MDQRQQESINAIKWMIPKTRSVYIRKRILGFQMEDILLSESLQSLDIV